MSLDPVIGVDFSGAKQDANTWMASGVLRSDGLQVNDIRSVTRDELLALLRKPRREPWLPWTSPSLFLNPSPTCWQALQTTWLMFGRAWPTCPMEEFIALRDTFVAEHGELRRECDLSHGEAFSVLHKANPNMLPMTLRGMQMLHRLQAPNVRVLCQDKPGPAKLTVLECMPGATLKGLRLPYKAYKKRPQARRATPTHPRRLGISCAGAVSQRRGGRRAVPSRPRCPRCRCGSPQLGGVHDLPRSRKYTPRGRTFIGWKGGFITSSQYSDRQGPQAPSPFGHLVPVS